MLSNNNLICTDAKKFDFFQAVRLIESDLSQKKQVVDWFDPQKSLIRFISNLSLAFPTTEIEEIHYSGKSAVSQKILVMVNFFGLVGAQSLLPYHYSEQVLDRTQLKDYSLRDFYDQFNHRLVALFYLSWKKNRSHIQYEQLCSTNQRDSLTTIIDALTGNFSNAEHHLLHPHIFRYHAGQLMQAQISAKNLEKIISNYFSVEVKILQNVKKVFSIPTGHRISLSATDHNNQLGINSILGKTFIDFQRHFCIQLGLLTYREFLNFLPQQLALAKLKSLVFRCIGLVRSYDLELSIHPQEVPSCQLKSKNGFNLGWNTWLGNPSLAKKAVVRFNWEYLNSLSFKRNGGFPPIAPA